MDTPKKVKIEKLFQPINIGKMRLKNRIVKLASQTNYANTDGSVSERTLHHYAEIARGGVGLLIVEGAVVDKSARISAIAGLSIDHDKYLPGLERLAHTIKVNGARAAIQLAHTGRMTLLPDAGFSVSASDGSFAGVTIRGLTIDEIQYMVEQFGEAASRARKAGFDAIEIHGHAGYLIGSFLSPFLNKRTDRYGGSLENRLRFPLEIVDNVKGKAGADYPLIFKFSADEHMPGGITLEEARSIARELEIRGIDAIDVHAGLPETGVFMTPPMAFPPGINVHLAEGIKKEVTLPVITSGRINDPIFAEGVLKEGKADLIGMARALIADPELPKKTAEGRLDDIRRCLGCNEGCLGRFILNLGVGCTVNAAVGWEKEFVIRQTDKAKKVVVVGGGPAGMETARVAALRGHDVTLFEQEGELGGQSLLAAIPPHREDIKNVSAYLSHQLKKLGVKIEMNKKVTAKLIKELKPDAVVIATGSKPVKPDMPGINGNNVVIANDILAGRVDTGRTVVVAGGGMVGSEVAEFLAEKGKEVTIVEMLDQIAGEMEMMSRILLLSRLQERGVRMFTGKRIEEITSEGVVAISNEGQRQVIKAETVVLTLGAEPENTLAEEMRGEAIEIYSVGDCVAPRKIIDAVFEGSYVARQI